jgi:hypothetical protein
MGKIETGGEVGTRLKFSRRGKNQRDMETVWEEVDPGVLFLCSSYQRQLSAVSIGDRAGFQLCYFCVHFFQTSFTNLRTGVMSRCALPSALT